MSRAGQGPAPADPGNPVAAEGRRTVDRVRAVLVPPFALAVVVGLDVVRSSRPWSVPVSGFLDEPGHLLTAWIVLLAVRPRWDRVGRWALIGAVAIDVDHIPLVLWGVPVSAEGGRPISHSLLTVLVVAGIAVAAARWRAAAGGLALGLLLHFVRDVATSTGLPLFWPALDTNVLLPYWAYLLALSAATALAVVRLALPGTGLVWWRARVDAE
jgi:inner membrane protein